MIDGFCSANSWDNAIRSMMIRVKKNDPSPKYKVVGQEYRKEWGGYECGQLVFGVRARSLFIEARPQTWEGATGNIHVSFETELNLHQY